jgi:hypothetical protein
MTDWRRGGVLGSLNVWVRREIAEHQRENPLARRARYPRSLRILRSIFSAKTFGTFLAAYFLLDLCALCLEAWAPQLLAEPMPRWVTSPAATELLKSVPSYLLGAQVSIFGVISLALALVTLIGQRAEAATDVKVYYHESLFFEVAASCLALTAALAVQFFWPLQFGLHLLGYGGYSSMFKLGLLGVHLAWFLLNLAAVARFIEITFGFVQDSSRERLRERFTANVVVPNELRSQLQAAVYAMAGSEAVAKAKEEDLETALFGLEMSEPYFAELTSSFRKPARLKNVYILPAHWAIRRWHRRCVQAEQEALAKTLPKRIAIRLWFLPRMGKTMRGPTDWCRRSGGVPLSWIERRALRLAFRFERVRDAD